MNKVSMFEEDPVTLKISSKVDIFHLDHHLFKSHDVIMFLGVGFSP